MRPVLCLSLLCCFLFLGGAEEDYRVHLEKAFEVMATRTMEYRELVGMGKWGRSEMKVYQCQKPDGRTLRVEKGSWNEKWEPREKLPPGVSDTHFYYTDEGFTYVYVSREKIRGIRMKQGIPRKKVEPRDKITGKTNEEVDGFPCWIIRRDRGKKAEGAVKVEEYVVGKESFVIRRERAVNGNGGLPMERKRINFLFSPVFEEGLFQVPPLDEIAFAKDAWEEVEQVRKFSWEIVQEAIPESQGGTRKSPLARREGFFLRSWRCLRRSPVRAATCGVLLLAVLSLGTSLALKRRSKKAE